MKVLTKAALIIGASVSALVTSAWATDADAASDLSGLTEDSYATSIDAWLKDHFAEQDPRDIQYARERLSAALKKFFSLSHESANQQQKDALLRRLSAHLQNGSKARFDPGSSAFVRWISGICDCLGFAAENIAPSDKTLIATRNQLQKVANRLVADYEEGLAVDISEEDVAHLLDQLNRKLATLFADPLLPYGKIPLSREQEGKWFEGGLTLSSVSRRNVDAGFDDGYVSPALIPGVSDAEPVDYAVPALDSLEKYGIEMVYTISSAHGADRKMRKIVQTKGPLEPRRHFAAIMEHVKKEAVEKYGFDIGR